MSENDQSVNEENDQSVNDMTAREQAKLDEREMRDRDLPQDSRDPRSNPDDYGFVRPLSHEQLWPSEQPRAEDLARFSVMPDVHPDIKVVNVGPSGTGGSYTYESRGGHYPHHPGGAYMPTDGAQAEAERAAAKAARAAKA